MHERAASAGQLEAAWSNDARSQSIRRNYSAQDVMRLRGSVLVEYTLARRGAERLWRDLHSEAFINALGAVSGNQAIQMAEAGLKAV